MGYIEPDRVWGTTDFPANYNGNITSQRSGTFAVPDATIQVYHYDQVNRLLESQANTGNYEAGIHYDLSGNITSLYRLQNGVLTDDMLLSYQTGTGDNTNQLQVVNDYSGSGVNMPTGTSNFTYDANGNLLTAPGRNISSITYNLLNLPSFISGLNRRYDYDANAS